jgi:hypothetical protein
VGPPQTTGTTTSTTQKENVMSITADPQFVAAEVAYRRQRLTAGLPTARAARRHHGALLSLLDRAPRLHHRHGVARTA